MKIEVLFPEYCNLFGDLSNIKYLKQCLPEAEFIETRLNSNPCFADEDVSMIYLGPMSERIQEKVIDKLKPLKGRIEELIDKGVVFLFTGNSFEVLGNYIEKEDGSRIEALGIFDMWAKQDMMRRHNSIFLGEYKDMEINGFKTQFTMTYPSESMDEYAFIKTVKGVGMNKKCSYEGICKNNFFGTYLVGPILINNPYFTKRIIESLTHENNPVIAHEAAVISAFNQRVKDIKEKV